MTNALRLLEYLVEEGEAGASEISRALDLTIGTVYRMVSTLSALGYVEQNPTNRRYDPGPKIPTLARHMTGGQDFVALARPHLERLMVQSGETVNLAALRETEVVYIDRAVTNQPVVAVLSSRASDRLDDIAPLVKEAAKELSELLQLTGNQSVA